MEDGKYRKKISTKNNVRIVKKLKNKKKYYFYITAGEKKQVAETDSNPSKVVSKKMKTYVRTTVFAGDSITEGLTYEDGFAHMPIGGKKRTIAYRGLNSDIPYKESVSWKNRTSEVDCCQTIPRVHDAWYERDSLSED